jgi:hypothetical protein
MRQWANSDSPEAIADLEREIDGCKKRWGESATLFYIDSNNGNEINCYTQLSGRYPTSVFAPECFSIVPRIHSISSPYQTGRQQPGVRNALSTQPQFVAIYPLAQTLINLADVPFNTENVTNVTNSMLRGDIQMVRIWLSGYECDLLRAATQKASAQGWPCSIVPHSPTR